MFARLIAKSSLPALALAAVLSTAAGAQQTFGSPDEAAAALAAAARADESAIGRNELRAIQASLAYVDAQQEYASKDRTGAGAGVYAERIVSHRGKKNGLYWPGGQGEDESPLGERFAQASREGYQPGAAPIPYHGYRFKILTRQGPNAPGGALNYIARGRMIGGFALVAYPAEYGNSGVMTFLVRHDGVVLQKDLGPQTGPRWETRTSPSSPAPGRGRRVMLIALAPGHDLRMSAPGPLLAG
jgi:hypothetical protein